MPSELEDLTPITNGETTEGGAPADEAEPEWGSEADVIAMVEQHWQDGDTFLSPWYKEAQQAYEFHAGKQWSDEDAEFLRSTGREPVAFNYTAQYVAAIIGQEQANRQETAFLPRTVNDGDPAYAEMMTEAVKWVRDQCDAETEDSDAFRDSTICGLGWTCVETCYERDPAGDVLLGRRSPFSMRYDPAACRPGLVDSSWKQCDYWFSLEEIEIRWPEKADELSLAKDVTPPSNMSQPGSDIGRRRYRGDDTGAQADRHKDKLRVIHDVWCARKRMWSVQDPISGRMRELSDEAYRKINRANEAAGNPIVIDGVPFSKKVWYQAWYCDGVLLDVGMAPSQVGCVYNAITGERDETSGYWYGVVRALIPAQQYINSMVCQIIQIVRTGAKGGLLVETGAVKSGGTRKFEEEWAKAASITWLEKGGLAGVKAKDPPQLPPASTQLLQFSMEAMRGLSGVNIEMMGATDRTQPGIVEDLRVKASMTMLAPRFDALRLYRKQSGRVLADFINLYISDGRMIRVVGTAVGKAIALRKLPDGMMYDVVVDEATTSRDVKARTFAALMQIVPLCQQIGVPIPPEVLDYAPLPGQLTVAWKRLIAQQKEKPPEKPLPLQIEEMKQQGQLAAQEQKQHFEAMRQAMEAETQKRVEAAQAASQMQIEQQKMAVKAFEAKLDVVVEAIKAFIGARADVEKAALQAQVQAASGVLANSVPAVPAQL